MKWLFIVHQVQTPNSRERVKVWRLTKKVGAVLYRNSVYVLPYNKERLEDFQWLAQQIRDAKGEASVFVSESQDVKENNVLRTLFEERSKQEFSTLLRAAETLTSKVRQHKNLSPSHSVVKNLMKGNKQLQIEFAALRKLDFFDHPAATEVESALNDLHALVTSMKPVHKETEELRIRSKRDFQRKVWSTREHIHIDRLCSAWLIRRFIDPKAKFVFAPETKLPKETIQFDVTGAEFSHHDDNCTFETLLKVFQIKDRILEQIAQIVHDIDLKDQKFNRAEAAGMDMIVRALSSSFHDDHKVLEFGSILLDSLYKNLAS